MRDFKILKKYKEGFKLGDYFVVYGEGNTGIEESIRQIIRICVGTEGYTAVCPFSGESYCGIHDTIEAVVDVYKVNGCLEIKKIVPVEIITFKEV